MPENSTEETPAPPELPPVWIKTELLDVVSQHSVELHRRNVCIERVFYLEDDDERQIFIDAAVEKLSLPGEKHSDLVNEIHRLLNNVLWDFRRHKSHIVLEPLSEAKECVIEWLWPGRIAADKLTMLVGDPGVGKSLVALDIAARVSKGRPWPDESNEPADAEPREPGDVLLLAEFDDVDDTIRPRLLAAGADLDRITLIRSFIRANDLMHTESLPFSVGGKLDMLADCVKRLPNCRLIVIDPLSAYVETNYTRRDLSALMQELVEIAVSQGVAILVVSHFSRGSHALFHYGSQANSRFVASARSVWKILGDGEHRDRRVLLPMKNNLGSDWLGLEFRIESAPDEEAPRIAWEHQPLEITVERSCFKHEVLELPNSYEVHRKMIREWLRQQLHDGERFAQDVLAAAIVARIGEKTLRKVFREMGGITRKGSTGSWMWSLTSSSSTDSCATKEKDFSKAIHESSVPS